MTNFRKITSLALAVLMILALFCGCGDTGSTSGVSTASVSSSSTTVAPTAEPQSSDEPDQPDDPYYVTLPLTEETVDMTAMVVWLPLMMQWYDSPNELPFYQELESRTNVHLEMTGIAPANYGEQLNILSAADELPDIVQSVGQYFSGGIDLAISDERIIDLCDYEEYMPNYFRVIEQSGKANDVYTADGHVGAAVMIYDQTFEECGPVSYVEWMDALNIESPVTIDDYHDMLSAMKVEYDAQMWLDKLGASQCSIFASAYGVMSYDNGTSTSYFQLDDNGTVGFGPAMDGYKSYLELMSKWYAEGLILTDFTNQTTQGSPEIERDIASGKISMFANTVGGMNGAKNYADNFPTEVGLHTPVVEEGDMLHLGRVANQVTTAGFSVSVNCENKELACRWLDYGYSEDGSLYENWGILGETYEVDADGSYHYTDLILHNEKFGFLALNALLNQFPPTLKTKASYVASLEQNCADAIELWSSCTDLKWMYPTYASMTSDELSDFNSVYADIKTCVQEYTLKCILGQSDVDSTWDEFQSTIKDLGLEKCIELKQAAYDRYIAK